MNPLDTLKRLIGRWQGPSRLWVMPTDPVRQCASTATFAPVAAGRFIRLDYTWSYEGKEQDGLFLFGPESAFWIDSWHMGDKHMTCKWVDAPDSAVAVLGSYAAPPGPDWQWRTTLEPKNDGTLRLLMHNIKSTGEEALAVEAIYTRLP